MTETPAYDKTITRKFYESYGVKQVTLFADDTTRAYLVGLALRHTGSTFIKTLKELLAEGKSHPEIDAFGERKIPHTTPDTIGDLIPLKKEITAMRGAKRDEYLARYEALVKAMKIVGYAHNRSAMLYSKATRHKEQVSIAVQADMWEEHTVMRAVKFVFATWAAGEYMVLSKDVEGFYPQTLDAKDMAVSVFEGIGDV